MRRVIISVKKFAIFCHRWMGVMFCLLFAWWFISGIFMMYTDFPSVKPADLRPLWKYSFPDGQEVYVNANTGAVAQYTTTKSRILAHLGPIPHWLYYTPLRVQQQLWTEIAIWTSGVATFVALLGLIVGIWMYSPSKRYRFQGNPARVPYTGQKRPHMIFGLFFGIVACAWAFSGMLSMDPFPSLVERGAGGTTARQITAALRPGDFHLEDYWAKPPQEALAETVDLGVRELVFTSFNGEPIYMASTGSGDTRIIPIFGVPRTEFTRERIFEIVAKAVAPTEVVEKKLLTQYDRHYLGRNRERTPLPVLFIRIGDAEHSQFYIDQRTGRVVAQHSDQSSFTTRWLYHGLHSLNFPWLYNYRPAWDIVVLILMLGGLAVCVTSVIIAGQVLGRKARLIAKSYGEDDLVAGAKLTGQSRAGEFSEVKP
jgi:hypothetical protein